LAFFARAFGQCNVFHNFDNFKYAPRSFVLERIDDVDHPRFASVWAKSDNETRIRDQSGRRTRAWYGRSYRSADTDGKRSGQSSGFSTSMDASGGKSVLEMG
jgi:hypothetical protein